MSLLPPRPLTDTEKAEWHKRVDDAAEELAKGLTLPDGTIDIRKLAWLLTTLFLKAGYQLKAKT